MVIRGLIFLIVGLFVVLYWIPRLQIRHLRDISPDKRFDAENEARKTLAQIIGGAVILVGSFLAWQQLEVSRSQLYLSGERQITERFSQAVSELSSNNLSQRLGAIYSLDRIAKDSERDYWPIIEILSAFVRENPFGANSSSVSKGNLSGTFFEPRPDIQAIMNVIKNRRLSYEMTEEQRLALQQINRASQVGYGIMSTDQPKGKPPKPMYMFKILSEPITRHIDLHKADLRGVNIANTHLEGVDISQTNLCEANLSGTHLEGANLSGTILERAHMSNAYLDGAELSGANLSYADLSSSSIKKAILVYVKGEYADFSKADFSSSFVAGAKLASVTAGETNFQHAVLVGSDMKNTTLDKAILKGATLGNKETTKISYILDVTGLTREQIMLTITDDKTILPSYLR